MWLSCDRHVIDSIKDIRQICDRHKFNVIQTLAIMYSKGHIQTINSREKRQSTKFLNCCFSIDHLTHLCAKVGDNNKLFQNVLGQNIREPSLSYVV